MSRERPRILFVDHVSKVLGGAEVNLLELLALPAAREGWDVHVACAPGSPLEAALAKLGLPRHPYGFAPALNELRVVGPPADGSCELWSLESCRRRSINLT